MLMDYTTLSILLKKFTKKGDRPSKGYLCLDVQLLSA